MGRVLISRQRLFKHFARIIELWPQDLLRPTVSFQDAMQRRVNHRILGVAHARADGNGKPEVAAYKLDEGAELYQVNALYSLLDDRYVTEVREIKVH
jgi:cytochrome b pre-mRNA-processing protein 6